MQIQNIARQGAVSQSSVGGWRLFGAATAIISLKLRRAAACAAACGSTGGRKPPLSGTGLGRYDHHSLIDRTDGNGNRKTEKTYDGATACEVRSRHGHIGSAATAAVCTGGSSADPNGAAHPGATAGHRDDGFPQRVVDGGHLR